MRILAALCTSTLLLAALRLASDADSQPAGSEERASRAAPHEPIWVKLTFGLDDKAVPWDGQLRATTGKILETVPWSFEKRDRFDPVNHKWFFTTVVLKGRSASSFAEPQRGVLVKLESPGDSKLAIATAQGNFAVDIASLETGKPRVFLDGRASAERLGSSEPLPDRAIDSAASTEDDFPSLAIGRNGHRWLAWIAYEEAAKKDRLRVLDIDDPKAKVIEIETAREQTDVKLIAPSDGSLRLFWSAPVGGNWEIHSTRKTENGWTGHERLTTAPGSDFHLDVAQGTDGDVWLAWQAFRNGHSDILARRLSNGKWSPEIVVAASEANEWEPAVSVAPDGTAWIAYDTYENGNYDVFLKSVSIDDDAQSRVSKPIAIATSPDFEAHATVDASDGETIWVACDAAGANWGKDYTRDTTEFKGRYSETLHASRRLLLRAVVDGEVREPTTPLPQRLTRLHPTKILHSDTEENRRFYELPHLVRDGDDRLWMLLRMNRQGYAGHPNRGTHWEFWATTFVDGKWLEPILLPNSIGRQNQLASTAIREDRRLAVAWSTGDHLVDLSQRIRIGSLPPVVGKPSVPELKPADVGSADTVPEAPVRSWTLYRDGQGHQVYFGDLHRHTDISLCFPTADGCLVDAYRYALDAGKLDFLCITDHTRDTDPFPWWRTQKAADQFYVQGVHAPFYGYERSNGTVGGGHRNVFFTERDWPVLRGDAHYSGSGEQRPDNNNPDVALYPHLKGKNAITAAHTPGYSKAAKRGTWTYHDPQVEPIAEIIQTFRRDYERPGEPQWKDARTRGAIAEEASLWYALARGHKLGFIASSDHHSTHMSYACVWATGSKREEIFEGLRNRRTYAATDKILLEVRMGDAVMGEVIAAPKVPELSIRIRGTAPIDEIQVVRNREVIHTSSPKKIDVQTRFRDDKYPGGAAYYYVRVRQADDNMAWGSPIWVK